MSGHVGLILHDELDGDGFVMKYMVEKQVDIEHILARSFSENLGAISSHQVVWRTFYDHISVPLENVLRRVLWPTKRAVRV